MAKFSYQSTPNPDSIKVVRKKGHFVQSGLLSFASKEEAESHELARSLFAVDGIINILILPDFLTITKRPENPWKSLWQEAEKVLERHFASFE